MGVYIVGMHRSGTSALAGLVSQLSDLPAARLAQPSNPGGQWERTDLRPALELLLADNDATWMHPPSSDRPLRVGRLTGPYLSRSFGRVADAPFLWKDPRLCLTIDFWLAQPQTEPKIIFIHRPVDDVASSLTKRNGWTMDRGRALWDRTNHNALIRLEGREVFVMSHARLLDDSRGVAEALQAWLELPADPAKRDSAAAMIRSEPSRSLLEPRSETADVSDQLMVTDVLAQLDFGPARMQNPTDMAEHPNTPTILGSPGTRELLRRRLRAVRQARQKVTMEVASPA